jgi:hypothetical protein
VDSDVDIDISGSGGESEYYFIWTVFEAMLVGDPMLRRDVVFVANESKRLGRPLTPGEYPGRISDAFMFPSSMSLEREHEILTRLVMEAGNTNSWENNFALLETYQKREGHCNVPVRHKEDGVNLGFWVQTQRASNKKGWMSADRKRRLDGVGIVWDPLAVQGEEMFFLLETYAKREGHCNVPKNHKEDGLNLGVWVQTQRQVKSKGGLRADKARRLEDIGFVWDQLEAQWEDNFALLETYAKREGHCNVHGNHKEDGANLGFWVVFQRQAKSKGGLRADKARRLERIGFVWDRHQAMWDGNFALLETYVKREGHCNVPNSHKEDGANLGKWVSHQREAKKKERLSTVRKRRLEDLDIAWDRLEGKWDDMFAVLETYVKREGHCNVPYAHEEDGANLGKWVQNHRRTKMKGGMRADKARRLEELGIVWGAKQQ